MQIDIIKHESFNAKNYHQAGQKSLLIASSYSVGLVILMLLDGNLEKLLKIANEILRIGRHRRSLMA